MDEVERLKLKQMAVDAIIKYPYGHPCVELAEALERAVEWANDFAKCGFCDRCDNHEEER